jgi:hypothetical protein
MEILDVCGNRSWRIRLVTHDEEARRFVDDTREEPKGWRALDVGWELEEPFEYTPEGTQVFTIDVRTEPSVRIDAVLEGRTMVIRAGDESACVASMRAATARETVEYALRWLTGWQHMGCWHVHEDAFWGKHTSVSMFVVPSPERWIAEAAPLPKATRSGRLGLFMAYTGAAIRFRDANAIVAAVNTHHVDAEGAVGVFFCDEPGTRMGFGVAEIFEQPPLT